MKCGFILQQVHYPKHQAKITHPLRFDLQKTSGRVTIDMYKIKYNKINRGKIFVRHVDRVTVKLSEGQVADSYNGENPKTVSRI